NAANIGDLKEQDGSALGRRDATDRAGKTGGLSDMLQRHLAANEVRGGRVRILREKFTNDANIPIQPRQAIRNEARIVADAAIFSRVAEEGEKFALPATDFENVLADDVMALHQLIGELAMECVEGGRKALRFLVLVGIGRAARLPGGIENKAASRTKRQFDIARREPKRLFFRRNQQATIGGHLGDGIKDRAGICTAIGAGFPNHANLLLDERK